MRWLDFDRHAAALVAETARTADILRELDPVTVGTLSSAEYETPFRSLRGDGETLHFHATDVDSGEWLATRTPEGVTWEDGHAKADVAVRGPAADLLLVLNRRWSPARVEVLGDAALLDHWIEHSKF